MQDQDMTRQDEAVAARLRKLSTMPLDLSRLEAEINKQIPREPERKPRWNYLFRPITAVAASITILVVVGLAVMMSSSNEVLASAAQMAQFHHDIVSNKIAVTKVDSIDAAGKVLADQWPQGPDLPRAPETHVMACCMKSIENKKVACVLLNSEGTPITMSVANASDMKSPVGDVVVRDGAKFHFVSKGSLNMVSTERHGRWVCLIGEVSSDRLITIARQLQF